MQVLTPACIPRHDPSWTEEDERAIVERLTVLREDIRRSGGLETWLDTRLEHWLAVDTRRCPVALTRTMKSGRIRRRR